MKKKIWSVAAIMVLLLLMACGKEDNVSDTVEDNKKTPTPIEVPTDIPEADISQMPEVYPTAEPTPEVTENPMPSPESTSEPTITFVPSAEPTVSAAPSPEPTIEPTATELPTPSPEPTPEPTKTPTPTVTPSPIPTPTINPNPLVSNGWQKMISIDEKYKIIFPEIYKESVVRKTDKEWEISYSCEDNKEIALTIGYTMLQKREYFLYEILSVGGSIIEERPSEKRTVCVWQLGNQKYSATFIDEEYARDLLGPSFGDEEWIPGVMHVVFSYPADKINIYETEPYGVYIVNNGEE